MDVSIATADERNEAKAATADESPPAPAPVRRATGPGRRAGTSPGTAIDPAVVFRFGKWAAVGLVGVLIIWGLFALFSSATKDRITKSSASAVAPVSASEPTVTLIALDTVRVSVSSATDGRVLLPETTLVRGQTQVVPKPGRIYIKYSQGKNLEVEIDGTRHPMPAGEGPARAAVN
jgi:hypothetical protein